MTNEEFLSRKSAIMNHEAELWDDVSKSAHEEKRVINVLENAATILEDFA